MPPTPELGAPSSEYATLRGAVLWASLGLPPVEQRLEALRKYQFHISEDMEADHQQNELSFEQAERVSEVKNEIAECLFAGVLVAEGRKWIQDGDREPVYSTEFDYESMEYIPSATPSYYRFLEHERTYTRIPSDFWRVDGIKWQTSSVQQVVPSHDQAESLVLINFIDVRVKTADLLRIFPPATDNEGAVPQSVKRPAGKPGRLPKYDKVAFFRLYALEAEVDAAGVLRTLPGFRERMSDLWYEMYGEPRPGDTWIGDRFTELNKDREKFKAARKRLDDP